MAGSPSHKSGSRRPTPPRLRLSLDELEAGWDGTTHRSVPSSVRGLKPGPHSHEAWARDAQVYHEISQEINPCRPFDDTSVLSRSAGYQSEVTASGLSSRRNQPAWDSSPFRPTPHPLKGLRPITREPWRVDSEFYNRNTTRNTIDDDLSGGGVAELGSTSYSERACNGRLPRPSFHMPNYERWAASLSA